MMNLKEFMLCLICDAFYQMQINSDLKEYKLEYQGDIMVATEGMFATIAAITNFFMHFIDLNEVLGYCIIIFRRLYNFFPHYRKHLEDPITIVLIQVLKAYSKATGRSDVNRQDPATLTFQITQSISQKLYETAQMWFNYFISQPDTNPQFL
jgi:hypothetical protein